jgi:hypothetical protein
MFEKSHQSVRPMSEVFTDSSVYRATLRFVLRCHDASANRIRFEGSRSFGSTKVDGHNPAVNSDEKTMQRYHPSWEALEHINLAARTPTNVFLRPPPG